MISTSSGERRIGADDLVDQGDTFELTCAPADMGGLRAALDDAGIAYDSADVSMVPTTTVSLDAEADARRVLRLIDALEEHDDVQEVYANFDIPDALLEAVEA